MEEKELKNLELFAATIRLDVLKMLKHLGYGHLGGSFSIVELLSVLYGKILKVKPDNPTWTERDYLVLSKGHAGPALYSALANKGYFEKKELFTLNVGGTNLPSHPDRLRTTGVDVTTGSLGQGTSQAAGIAYGLKEAKKDNRVYLIVGDGELNEGQCWEAFQFIAHYKLDNLIVIIDENKRQLDGYTKDIINPFDIKLKMEAFGFQTLKTKGNDIRGIYLALTELKKVKNTAKCLVLDSIKGQGIKYFEDLTNNHSVKFNNDEINYEAKKAINNLETFISNGGELNV